MPDSHATSSDISKKSEPTPFEYLFREALLGTTMEGIPDGERSALAAAVLRLLGAQRSLPYGNDLVAPTQEVR